jgi:periplasmic protein TonB
MVGQRAIEQSLFADSMLQSSWAQRSRRSLSTLTSFGMQAIVIGLIILLSLLKSVVTPTTQTVVTTPLFASRLAPEPISHPSGGGSSAPAPVNPDAMIFRRPGPIHIGIYRGGDEPSPEPPGIPGGGVDGGFSGGGAGLPDSLFNGNRAIAPPPPPKPITREFKTSDLLEGMLIRRVQPSYPPLARSVRIQGAVILEAVISKTGTIDNLHVVSGHPMLVPAAIAAVSQWRYRPYILNHEPIEVETQITVNFSLAGN